MDEEFDLEELLEAFKEQRGVWGNTVPIKKEDNVYNCYITGDIGSPRGYNELHYILEIAKEGDIVKLHINTGGGYIDSAFQIVAGIKKTKAFVIAHIVGTVASAGTIIALSCDEDRKSVV